MKRVRLSSATSAIAAGDKIVLRSDLDSYQLDGRDVSLFLEKIRPLLQAAAGVEELVAALPEYDAASVRTFIEHLTLAGVVESVPDDTAPSAGRLRGQTAFLRRWSGRGEESSERLRTSRALIVGLEPWGIAAARDLAAAGVGALDLRDDGTVSETDFPFIRGLRDDDVGRLRRDVVARLLAEEAPQTATTTGPIVIADRVLVEEAQPGLILVTVADDELLVMRAAAAFANRRRIPSITAYLAGSEAIIGPMVVQGTPCWNCTRLRLLANSDTAETDHALHAVLLHERAAPRSRTYLASMPALAGSVVSTDAIALLSGYTQPRLIGRILTLNLKSFETTFHTVVPMPWCVICGGAALMDGGAAAPQGANGGGDLSKAANTDELRDALAGWVDPRVGVVRYAMIGGHDAREPQLPITATATLARYTEGTYNHHEPEIGSGKGLTKVDALLGAVGEAVERYSAARYDPASLTRASFAELQLPRIDPRDLVLYDDRQYEEADFPYSRFDAGSPIWWCPGTWLDDDEKVLVPALMAYFDFHAPQGERICQVTSNGLAAGASLDDAALRATWELIERDAFMMTWLARLPARRIEYEGSIDPMLGEVVRELASCGASLELYLLNAGIDVPVVLALGIGDGVRWPAVTAALAAHADGATAVRKAVLEQGHVGPYVRRLMLRSGASIPESADDVRTLNDHALYYVPPSRRSAFDFLRHSTGRVRLNDLPAAPAPTLSGCASACGRAGVRVAVADVTSPDTRLGPFRVARALGVNMQPIHFGHRLARLANPRLRALAQSGINPDPHPLA